MARTNLFHNTALRLAIAFTGLFALAMIVLGLVIYPFIASDLESRLKRDIEAERATLLASLQTEGVPGLTTAVSRRVTVRNDGQTIYLLADGAGKRLTGNIKAMPPFAGWKTVPFEQLSFIRKPSDDADDYFLFGTRFENGFLIVGRSRDDVEEQLDIILNTLGWGLTGIIILGAFGAFWAGRRTQRRIDEIGRVLDTVAAGNLDRRIALDGSGDDIDRIAVSINQAIERLAGLIDSIRQVSTDIAHELKTQIGRLRQKLEQARGSTRKTKELRLAVDEAVTETETIVETFDALLRIAQIEAGARKSRFKIVDLRAVLANIVEIYEPVAENQGYQLTANLEAIGSWRTMGDIELLTQMFANIIENAIRHCPTGSAIAVLLERAGDNAVVSIADNGPGIPEPDRDKVFRRLYRAEKSRTTPGSGLGLSLVSAIADLHGAHVRLGDNQPGLKVEIEFELQG